MYTWRGWPGGVHCSEEELSVQLFDAIESHCLQTLAATAALAFEVCRFPYCDHLVVDVHRFQF